MTSGPDLAAGAGRVLEALGRDARLAWTQQTLSHSADHRFVVLYTFHDAAGRPVASAVAKTYPDDEGAGTYAAMRDLADLVARSGRTVLDVPDALGWDPALRLLVMETVSGTSYRDLARDPAQAPRLERAGEALAVLHSLPVPADWAPPRGLAEHARDLARPDPCALMRARPGDAGRIEAVYAAALAGEASDVPPAPLHRDFHLGQLVARGDGVAVLDWDLYAAGDPALDVANLLVYLETRLGNGAAAMQDAVRRGYARGGDAAVLERLAAYEALTYLRMAAKRHRLGDAGGGPLEVGELLTRAESRLS